MVESLLIALAILVTPFIERAIRHADETKAQQQFLEAVLEAINLVTINLGKLQFPTEFTLNLASESTVNSRTLPQPTIDDEVKEFFPADVLEYIEGWNVGWAKDAARQRARRLYKDLGSWPNVLAQMQLDDTRGS